jgi:hypothetical protein
MEDYPVTSRAYLSRALQRLESSRLEDLYYAAFELRCGVEARLQEYLDPHEFIPVKKRRDWHSGNLHMTATKAFQTGDAVQRACVYDSNDAHIVTLYYVPVTTRLKTISEMLGAHLHSAKKYRCESDDYWVTFRALLDEGSKLLADATAGTLLGPIMINEKTGIASMPAELLTEREETSHPLMLLRGKSVRVEITYHDTLNAAATDS